MPIFKVEIDRPVNRDRNRNPFLGGLPHPSQRIDVLVRSWEFEARDEDHVRQLFAAAVAADLPNVRGFQLRRIVLSKDT